MTPEIAFRTSFREAILSGGKTATSRTRVYGEVGQVLNTAFGPVELVSVYQQTLSWIRFNLWREEGCESPEDFERVWRSIHRGHFNPLQIVWVHRFRLAALRTTKEGEEWNR